MKKSLSLLVAIAMVFSMFATVVSAADATEQSAGEYLNELGVILGNQDGDLKEDQTWKRQDVAVLLSRLMGVEEVAKKAGDKHGFTDVTDANYNGYITWAVEEGLFEGKGFGKFGFGDELKNQEFFALVLRVFGEETTGDDYANVPDLAVEYGFADEDTDFAAIPKRGATYETIVAALKTEVGENGETLEEILGLVEVVTPAIEATPVGAKKVEVKFNKAVDDTKVKITVKKGPSTINATSKYSEDKKSVVLELASKLTAGEYTVSVEGVEDKALTDSFTAVNETVAKIEFLSKNAPLKALPSGGSLDTELEIPYQVLNNYGENVTKTTTLSSNIAGAAGGPVSAKGIVVVKGQYRLNDAVTVSLIHAQTATSIVETFTVVAPARVAEIEISGLYNKDGKTLDDSTNLATDPFYLLVSGKDQYGNAINDAARFSDDVIVNQTNTTVVTVPTAFEKVEVDGADKVGLKLGVTATGDVKVGTSTITLISNTQGKSANFNIVVAETVRADVINLINPGDVYAKEKAIIPVEVFDKNGNAIVDAKVLNAAGKGVSVTSGGLTVSNAFVAKDGGVQIEIPANHGSLQAAGQITVVAQSASYKVQHVLLTVKEASVPKVIRGLKADYAKAFKTNSTGVELKHSNIDVEDQHGRVMTNDQVAAWLSTTNTIKITETDATTVNFGTTNVITNAAVAKFNVGNANGSEKITIELVVSGTAVPNSAAEVTLTATDGTQYTSYSVDAIGKVYDIKSALGDKAPAVAPSEYEKEIKVYGVLANGSKVRLANNEFIVSALTNATVDEAIIGDKILVNGKLSGYADNGELTVPVTVTIGANGKKVEQNVTFSKEVAKVASVKFITGSDLSAAAQTSYTAGAGNFAIAGLVDGDIMTVVATDQYGVKVAANDATGKVSFPGVTIDPLDAKYVAPINATYTVTSAVGSVNVTGGNGTVNAVVEGFTSGEEFDLTVTFVGGQTAVLRVKA